jgi:hypothetical protein
MVGWTMQETNQRIKDSRRPRRVGLGGSPYRGYTLSGACPL